MSTMNVDVYDAFLSAGVSDGKARKAAEAMHNDAWTNKNELARLERTMLTRGDIIELEKDVNRIDKEVSVIKWMLGFNLLFTMVIFWRLFH